jgi:hypothetical protein
MRFVYGCWSRRGDRTRLSASYCIAENVRVADGRPSLPADIPNARMIVPIPPLEEANQNCVDIQ